MPLKWTLFNCNPIENLIWWIFTNVVQRGMRQAAMGNVACLLAGMPRALPLIWCDRSPQARDELCPCFIGRETKGHGAWALRGKAVQRAECLVLETVETRANPEAPNSPRKIQSPFHSSRIGYNLQKSKHWETTLGPRLQLNEMLCFKWKGRDCVWIHQRQHGVFCPGSPWQSPSGSTAFSIWGPAMGLS